MSDASKDPFESDEPLDRLLQRSVGSDVDADRLDRLADHWRLISRRRRRVQTGWTMIVCLAMCVSSFLLLQRNRFDVVQGDASPERRADPVDEVVRQLPPSDANTGGSAVAADAIYDRLICVAIERKIRQQRHDTQSQLDTSSEPEAIDAKIGEIIAAVVQRRAQRQADDDLVGRIKQEGAEQELLTWIETAEDAESIDTALQLLTPYVTSRSLPALMRLRATHPQRCTRIIAQIADPQLLFQLAQQEPDESLVQELAAALLRHRSPRALPLFLQLVDNRPTSAVALAAVAKVETLPTDRLIQCLVARSRKVRLTAAMVLAQSKDPHVSARLVPLLRDTQTRRAAMVALVASDNELARQFVEQASRDVYLAASVHAAQTVVNSFRMKS